MSIEMSDSAVQSMHDEVRLMMAQQRHLAEVLEVGAGENLAAAVERLVEEVKSLRQSREAAQYVIEKQNQRILHLEGEFVEARIWADKQHAADQAHIEELHNAIEPKQALIYELTVEVNRLRGNIEELRQAILRHITQTS